MPDFEISTLRDARIHHRPNVHPAVAFAAAELRRYLRRLTGVDVPVSDQAEVGGKTTLTVGVAALAGPLPRLPERGSYAVRVGTRSLSLFGGSPRALLAAVYALLEGLGCRWSLHGSEEERVPDLSDRASLAIEEMQTTPAFRLRGYTSDIMTWHYTQPEKLAERLPEDRELIDWMGKSGANTFFYIRHPFDSQLAIPELAAEFARRAIDVEYGGHVIPLLLPREHFRDRPDLFPAGADGDRADLGNLCASNPTALALVAENAAAYVGQHPEMSALHVWGADLWGGGWCRCARCAKLTPQDQGVLTCNAVARGLADANLARGVCYLAYHDTLAADLSVEPDPRVICEWAPRERCYGHALADPACERNRGYRESLLRYLDLFAGRVRLFEYFGDAILYFGCALPLAEVIAADMEYYRSLGIREALMLQFGAYSTWAYPLNFLAFAETSNRGGCASASLRTAYCQRFGSEAILAHDALRDLEGGMRRIAQYGDLRVAPRQANLAAAVQAAIGEELPRFSQCVDALSKATHPWLRSQADLLRYTTLVLEGVAQDIAERGSGAPLFERALAIAQNVDQRLLGSWGRNDLSLIHSFFAAAADLTPDHA